MVEEREDAHYHKFFIPRTEDIKLWVPDLNAHSNMIYLPNNKRLQQFFFMYKLFSKAENIVIHGMFFGYWPLVVLLSNKKFLEKLSWIEWTGDVYLWKLPEKSLKNRIKNFIGKKIRENVKFIVMSAPNDKDRFEQEFDISNKKILELSFPSNRNVKQELADVKPNKYKSDFVLVQIGHNAYSFNKHIMLIDMLEKFKNENMRIVLPLAYGWTGLNGAFGSMNYMNAVKKFAKDVFKKKALIFAKSIPLSDYSRFLWNVDIAIFGFDRLAGASNVYMLLYMGKKIFFDGSSPHYKFFKEQGFDVYDLYDIPNMTYEEFIAPAKHDSTKWLDNIYNNDYVINRWNEEFYQYLESKDR